MPTQLSRSCSVHTRLMRMRLKCNHLHFYRKVLRLTWELPLSFPENSCPQAFLWKVEQGIIDFAHSGEWPAWILHKKKAQTSSLLHSGNNFWNKVATNAFCGKSYRSHCLPLTYVAGKAINTGICHKKITKGKRQRERWIKCTKRKAGARNQNVF